MPAAVATAFEIDAEAALGRVLELMAIPGKSGEEGAVVDYVRDKLLSAGVPASAIRTDDANKRSPIGGDTGSLIVSLPGTRPGPRRLLMAHLDTVPLCVGSRPVVEGDLVRSANPQTALGGDDRGGTAVVLTAAVELLRSGLPHPPLTFFWPVQEEIGLYGARLVDTKVIGNPRLCFNWDGGSAAMACIGATGSYDIDIEIAGIASHAGVHPEGGVSAMAIASLAIADLQQNGWHGLIVKGRQRGTSNVGLVHGGDATNVVMPDLKLNCEVRSHDPKFRDRLVREFRKAFEKATKSVKNDVGDRGQLRFEADLKYESFKLSEDEPAVKAALRAIADVGLAGATRISNGGLDANWLSARGLPTVTLGCGQDHVHTTSEILHIPDYLNACRIAFRLAAGAK